MKDFMVLCLLGESSIPERKRVLDVKLKELEHEKQRIEESIKYINWKQNFYDDVLMGKTKYYSNLTTTKNDDN